MNVPGNDRNWRVGELAEATGLTVRTLHHYHEIGLLAPSDRNAAGHRLYTPADVGRLYQIRALRGFGLSLTEIGEALAGTSARSLLERQLEQVTEQITAAQRLRQHLTDVLGALDDRVEPSVAEIVTLIEVMTTVEQKLTPQQVREMSEQRARFAEQLTAEELAAMSKRRKEAAAGLSPAELAAMTARRTAMMPSTPPEDPAG
ncbi:MAG TPA: MerR family transcriptional regulator [Pseudonocardiaceae bacterium]|nr:MerR family transcriptional regulator [Pseudonocardiaceae bacterium]